jgi:alpha-L-fucosidase
VVAFGAAGLCASPARWVGTESGYAPYPCWSTAADIGAQGAGDPDGGLWIPAETDFTLQNGDSWFFSRTAGVRSIQSLQAMYETSSGHNAALIIDFAPQPNGTIPPQQVATAAALGAYVTACYGAPIVQTSGNSTLLTLMPSAAVTMDRVVVREDQRLGQIVRAFTITATLGDGSAVQITPAGSSIGNKFIQVFAPLTVAMLTLNITGLSPNPPTPGGPFILDFSSYECEPAARAASEGLQAQGFEQPAYVPTAQRISAAAAAAAASARASPSGAAPRRRRLA